MNNRKNRIIILCMVIFMVYMFYFIDGNKYALYKQIAGKKFVATSGLGTSATEITVDEKGNITGVAYDLDVGCNDKSYPNGTWYYCEFEGKFSEPQKINDHMYKCRISKLNYLSPIGKDEIKDGYLYSYQKPRSMGTEKDVIIYTPRTPMSEISQKIKYWLWWRLKESIDTVELPNYVISIEEMGYMCE